MSTVPSQVSPHHAVRTDLPGPFGPIAALRATPRTPFAGTERPPLAVLVPGYTGSKEDFAPILDPIAAAGIEVVAIDLPGQYESPGSDDEDDYLPEPLGEVVRDLLRPLVDRYQVLLLGHSYGGLVCRAAALLGAPISGLTLLDSGPAELPIGERRAVLEVAGPLLRTEGIEVVQQLRETRDAQNPTRRPQSRELQALLRERFLRSSPAGLLGMAEGLRSEPDLVPQLAKALRNLDVPCLVMCGAEDDAWPVADQRDMADRLDADFAVIPDAEHSPALDNPDALIATLVATWHAWLS